MNLSRTKSKGKNIYFIRVGKIKLLRNCANVHNKHVETRIIVNYGVYGGGGALYGGGGGRLKVSTSSQLFSSKFWSKTSRPRGIYVHRRFAVVPAIVIMPKKKVSQTYLL